MSRVSTAKSSNGPGKNSLGSRSRGRGNRRFSSEPRRQNKNENPLDRFAHFRNTSSDGRKNNNFLQNELVLSSSSQGGRQSPTSELNIQSSGNVRGRKGRGSDKSERFLEENSDVNVSGRGAQAETSQFYFADEMALLEEEGMEALSQSIQSQNRAVYGSPSAGGRIQTRHIKPVGLQALFCAHCANALHADHGPSNSLHSGHSKTKEDQLSSFLDTRPPLSPLEKPSDTRNWDIQIESDSEEERLESSSKAWVRPNLRNSDSSESD